MPNIPGVGDHAAPDSRPEPVLSLVRLGALVSAAVVAIGGVVSLISTGQWSDFNALGKALGAAVIGIGALVAYAAPMWQAHKARAKVTPLSSPRNGDGQALMVVPGLSSGPR